VLSKPKLVSGIIIFLLLAQQGKVKSNKRKQMYKFSFQRYERNIPNLRTPWKIRHLKNTFESRRCPPEAREELNFTPEGKQGKWQEMALVCIEERLDTSAAFFWEGRVTHQVGDPDTLRGQSAFFCSLGPCVKFSKLLEPKGTFQLLQISAVKSLSQ
jgi:hypothetical protein